MEPKPSRPYADSAIAKYISKQIDALADIKSQRDIANEIGYQNANMVSMFKRGEAKVPLDKIPQLAKALRVDVAHLFRLGLEQYWPGLGDTIGLMLGRIATENEDEIFLAKWRKATKNMDPAPNKRINAIIDRALNDIQEHKIS